MTRAVRRLTATILGVLAFTALHSSALAAEADGEGGGGLDLTALVIVAAITIAIPVLFLVAVQLRAPGEGEEEEIEPVVSGIAQGRAPVPRWLYAVYILIPAWSLFYLINNTEVRGELAPPTPVPTATPEAPAPPTDGPPVGGPIRVVALNIEFDVDVIRVPAGQEVVIELVNRDAGIPHNISVYDSPAMAETIYRGELFNGVATRTIRFDPPPVGTYFFHCDVHPNMRGDFIVE